MEYQQALAKHDLGDLMAAPNVIEMLSKDDTNTIGIMTMEGYKADEGSRTDWAERQANANKLALQVQEAKSFPWPNCANVKFPLVTVAAFQYAAKAYPALITGTDLVKVKIYGMDPSGEKSARALRLSTHMTWQNLEQDADWEDEHDRLLPVQAIAGCAFIKRTFDPQVQMQRSSLVLPANLVTNYFTKTLETSERYTHQFFLSANEIRQRELEKRFSEVENVSPDTTKATSSPVVVAADQRQGTTPSPSDRVTPYFTGEQYCWIDLDGDGYREPYIVTFDINTGAVRRIVARFLNTSIKPLGGRRGEWKKGAQVYDIAPVKVFQNYVFMPSPDGGFYGLGLGAILGPINQTINTTINQMLDAGTMATLGGGFLGRGFRGKGGAITFQPGQWYPVDAPGDDLRKSIFGLPVPQPSQVLLSLLGLLLQYGERIVSATDLQVGENIGQNTPAATAQMLNENGARVYSAIHKRTWRAMKGEFNVQYDLNRLFLNADQDFNDVATGQGAMVRESDYEEEKITVRPAADPHIVSDTQLVDQGKMLVQMSGSLPGFNRYQAMLRFLKALKVPDIDQVLPPPMQKGPDGQPQPAKDFPPPQNPKMIEAQIKQAAQQLKEKEFQSDQLEMKITLQLEVQETVARIQNLQAQAAEHLANAKNAETEPAIKLLFAQIEAEGKHRDSIIKVIDLISSSMQKGAKNGGDEGAGLASMEAPSANAAAPAKPKGNGANGAGRLAASPA